MPKTREDKGRVILAKEGKYHVFLQTYSQYKIKDKTPWFSYVCWERFTLVTLLLGGIIPPQFLKKLCGRPKQKNKDGRGSIYLTLVTFSIN